MRESATRLPAGTRPGRIGLAVSAPYEVSSFYEDVVGLTLSEYTETTAQLGVDDRTLVELTDGEDRAARDHSEAGLYHVAFEFPSRRALADALLRIDSFYELDGATDHGIMQSLYLTDPAGNGVELYVTAPREEWPENDAGEPIMETDPLSLDALRADATAETTAPEETRIGHFHLEVTDLPTATAFYRDEVGLPVTRSIGDMARFFAAGDSHHDLGLTNFQERSEPASGVGLDWIEWQVPGESAIEAAADRFEDAGRAVEKQASGIAVRDPDGIGVRLADASE